jgi:hypothetical protein
LFPYRKSPCNSFGDIHGLLRSPDTT